MDRTEQIYRLVKKWCRARDPLNADAALRQLAILTGCLPNVPNQLSEQDHQQVLQWLQQHYPHAYLWVMSQQCIGHPAMVWGTASASRKMAVARRQ